MDSNKLTVKNNCISFKINIARNYEELQRKLNTYTKWQRVNECIADILIKSDIETRKRDKKVVLDLLNIISKNVEMFQGDKRYSEIVSCTYKKIKEIVSNDKICWDEVVISLIDGNKQIPKYYKNYIKNQINDSVKVINSIFLSEKWEGILINELNAMRALYDLASVNYSEFDFYKEISELLFDMVISMRNLLVEHMNTLEIRIEIENE